MLAGDNTLHVQYSKPRLVPQVNKSIKSIPPAGQLNRDYIKTKHSLGQSVYIEFQTQLKNSDSDSELYYSRVEILGNSLSYNLFLLGY